MIMMEKEYTQRITSRIFIDNPETHLTYDLSNISSPCCYNGIQYRDTLETQQICISMKRSATRTTVKDSILHHSYLSNNYT